MLAKQKAILSTKTFIQLVKSNYSLKNIPSCCFCHAYSDRACVHRLLCSVLNTRFIDMKIGKNNNRMNRHEVVADEFHNAVVVKLGCVRFHRAGHNLIKMYFKSIGNHA